MRQQDAGPRVPPEPADVRQHPILRRIVLWLGVALAVRLLLAAWMYFVSATLPVTVPAPDTFRYSDPHWDAPWDAMVLEPWRRWDTEWYLKIAQAGYNQEDGSAAFYPLFPLLMRVLGSVMGGPLAGALVATTLAAAACLVLLESITRLEFGSAAGQQAVILLLAFPTAFFLMAGYTESLFLALALGALLAARRRMWFAAGLCGGLAVLTRPNGYLLLLPLALEFWLQWRTGKVRVWEGAYLALVPAGLGLYAFYLWWALGDPILPLRAASQWRLWVWPWQSLGIALQSVYSGQTAGIARNLIDLAVTLVFGGLAWGVGQRMRPTYAAYMVAMLVFPLMTLPLGGPANPVLLPFPLQSISRYLLVAFPAFMLLGHVLKHPLALRLYLYPSLLLQMLLAALFALWYPIL